MFDDEGGEAFTAPPPEVRDYPDGFDRQQAFALAPRVRDDVAGRKYSYSRQQMKDFQRAAGVAADGIYGGGSAGALRHYLGGPPPRPLFKPTAEKPYPHAD